jgi:hypothetical protein
MSRRAGSSPTSVLLAGGLVGLAAGALGYLLIHGPPARASLRPANPGRARAGEGRAVASDPRASASAPRATAARRLYAGSAALASSVLIDSGLEHYRGGLYNPVMYVAPVTAALTVATSGAAAVRAPSPGVGAAAAAGPGAGEPGTVTAGEGASGVSGRAPVFAASVLVGLIGSGFHTYNISRRAGGWRWMNLFYGAPLAAPMGLVFAGLFGLAADRLLQSDRREPEILGLPLAKALALGSATGLVGTAAEAGLLHFRGAFHDSYMLLPVTVPPLAAVALAGSLFSSNGGLTRVAELMLRATEALGFAGVGFHAFGVQRNMGGWRNWSQMIQQGPPLPAPPSFTGMALAGRACLALIESRKRLATGTENAETTVRGEV